MLASGGAPRIGGAADAAADAHAARSADKENHPLELDESGDEDGKPSAADGEDARLEDLSMSDDDGDDDDATSGKIGTLDKAMMNELLLVCSNLGMLRVDNDGQEPVFMRGEDCEEWIHDLQRAIRRDHMKHRLITKQLGKWKVLQKKLLPLLVNHQHDWYILNAFCG